MLSKRIIPCLDVKEGRVVKGVRFVGLRDAGDPVEVARRYDAAGADEITFLDITASHEDRGTLLNVVERTAEMIFTPLTVGGGRPGRGRHQGPAGRGRGQGRDQHGGRDQSGSGAERLGPLGRAGHRGGDRARAPARTPATGGPW